MSDSDAGRNDGDRDFDRDDGVRALLRGADPAASLPPADPAALQSLLEDIMSADLEVRPPADVPGDVDQGDRATGTHGRNRTTWLVAAAAAAVIAGVGGFAATGFDGDGAPTPQAGETHTSDSGGTGEASATAPLAGETTRLGVAAQQGRCAQPTPQILSQYPLVFQGTVTAIEGQTVTLATTETLNGEVGESVEVTAPQAQFTSMVDAADFEVGGDYYVAAADGQVSMCYSGEATGALRSAFEKAFVR